MTDSFSFDSDEAQKISQITKYYELTKELLIFGEQVDPENATLVQAINELRNCLDHLMRVTSVKLGLRNGQQDAAYISTNLDKSYGHVYRAAYDTLDWVSLTLRGRISDELEPYSNDTIQAALPDYFSSIRPRLEHLISTEITKLRLEKDVAADSEKNLEAYVRITAETKKLFEQVVQARPALIEHHNRSRQARRRRLLVTILKDGAIAILAAGAGAVITWAIVR